MAQAAKKSSLHPIIFDTDILIWYFRGNLQARTLLESIPKEKRWISSLAFMELLQGARNQDEIAQTQAFISENISTIVHPKTSISEHAIHLVGQFALSHGLRVIDAMIASSAILHRAILATGNYKHFRFIPSLEIKTFHIN